MPPFPEASHFGGGLIAAPVPTGRESMNANLRFAPKCPSHIRVAPLADPIDPHPLGHNADRYGGLRLARSLSGLKTCQYYHTAVRDGQMK